MIYGSVCSGIEAASVAWEPLGWQPAWFAEIEPFPSAVLAHHWPHVTNLGDMTRIADAVLSGDVIAPDVLVGGTPCQAFSVAGARKGLADDRGFLTIKYVELANAIDQQRAAAGAVPCITVWENVPGVLSSKDNAFGSFLGLLAGEDCELVPPGGRWSNAGCVLGPQRAVAWRVLDAQYFGVAQRRRRLFVVASARAGFDPAAVLFERDGLRRDTPPSRETGSVVAALTANGVGTCGADDNQGQAGHLIPAAGCWWDGGQVSQTLDAVLAKGQTMPEKNRFPAVLQPIMTVHGTQDPDTNTELAHTLGRNQGQENAVLAKYNSIKDHDQSVIFAANNWDELVQENAVLTQFGTEIAGTLTARHDSSPCADRGMNVLGYIDSGNGGLLPHEPMGTLVADSPSGGGRPLPACVYADLAVRRLTPVECDRLQGFPDNRTRIPLRKYSKKQVTKLRPDDMWELIDGEWWLMAADGPRYKAIGNSMAVPCMVWIGKRIALHLSEIGLPCADEEAA